MKLIGFIFTILYLQASASFLNDFRSAMSNVERGFGKLLTDVVTDVTDTIHCTISAVERVLVLNGLLDKTSTYSYRCRDFSKSTKPTPFTPPKIRDQRSLFDRFNWLKYPNHDSGYRNSPRHLSMELRKSIASVNKTINEILSHRQVNSNPKIISKTIKDETNRLTEVSKILKQEIENISSNIRLEIQKLHFNRYESNVESVWDEIKILHDLQQSSKNTTEINEIRNILDKVVDKLYLNSDDYKISGNYNLKEIRKKLQKYSDSDDKYIENDSGAYLLNQDLSLQKSEAENTPRNFQDVTTKILNQKKGVNPTIQPTTEKSLFNLESDSYDFLNPFSKTNTNNEKIINDAKKIIEDSQHTDKVLYNFFNEHTSGSSVFSNPELFDFSN